MGSILTRVPGVSKNVTTYYGGPFVCARRKADGVNILEPLRQIVPIQKNKRTSTKKIHEKKIERHHHDDGRIGMIDSFSNNITPDYYAAPVVSLYYL